MKSKNRKTKGITPVIATILLLLITIAIVGVSMVFFTRTVSTSTGAGDEQLKITTEQASKMLRIDNAAGTSVTIRNMGTQSIAQSELSVFVDNSLSTCTWTGLPVAKDGSATCTLGSSCTGKKVKVAGPAGSDELTCS